MPMGGRFPPDLMIVVFGPLAVVAIAFGLGSLIFRIAGQYGSTAAYVVAVSVVISAVFALLLRLRRR